MIWRISSFLEAVAQMCSVKKVLLEISQNSLENNCLRVSFLKKLQAWSSLLLNNAEYRIKKIKMYPLTKTSKFNNY